MVQIALPEDHIWRGIFYQKGDRDVPSDLAAYLNLQAQAVAKSPGVVSMVHRFEERRDISQTHEAIDLGYQLKEFDRLFVIGHFNKQDSQVSTCWVPVRITSQNAFLWEAKNNNYVFLFANPLSQLLVSYRTGDPIFTITAIEIYRAT